MLTDEVYNFSYTVRDIEGCCAAGYICNFKRNPTGTPDKVTAVVKLRSIIYNSGRSRIGLFDIPGGVTDTLARALDDGMQISYVHDDGYEDEEHRIYTISKPKPYMNFNSGNYIQELWLTRTE